MTSLDDIPDEEIRVAKWLIDSDETRMASQKYYASQTGDEILFGNTRQEEPPAPHIAQDTMFVFDQQWSADTDDVLETAEARGLEPLE